MRKSKRCLVASICGLLFAGVIFAGIAWLIASAKVALNQNRLAVIESIIAAYLLEGQTVPLPTYIAKTDPRIEVRTNAVLDRYHMPVRHVIEDRDDGIFISVYSAGRDKKWGTRDDQKREGFFLRQGTDEQ